MRVESTFIEPLLGTQPNNPEIHSEFIAANAPDAPTRKEEIAVMGNCQRPLRGQTAQGERISLANSEQIPAGTKIVFDILILDKKYEKLVIEWLEYGELRGVGQWRNSGKGRFTFKVLD